MKKILVSLVFFALSFSRVSAGLFEYHMNGTLDNYVKFSKEADVVEQIAEPTKYSYTPSYNSSSSKTIFANDYYKGGYNYSTSNKYYRSNGSYRNSDYKNMLRDELRRFQDEQDFIDDRKDEIIRELRNIDRYNTSYYNELRKDLERESNYLEDREDELIDIIDDLEEDIEDVDDNGSIRYDFYYNDYGQRVYFDNKYNQNTNYYDTNYYSCSRGSNRYDSCQYDAYYYDSDYYNTYLKKNWVNPNLKPVKDGHIYIR